MIETERLILRYWEDTKEDKEALVDGLNNYNVSKWTARIPYPYTLDDAQEFIDYTKSQDRNINMNFAIVLKETNEVIGGTEITSVNKLNGTAGGGIWLNEKYQAKGYGIEAFSAKIKYAFEELGLRRMENGYFKDNEKSHQMQLKLGFKDEGIRRKRLYSLATKQYEDECITGLLKEEFVGYINENGT